MKKYSFLIVVLFLIIIIVFLILKPKNYTINYKVNNATIKETYKKNVKKYYLTIKTKDNTYEYIYKGKYSINKRLIKKVKTFNYEKSKCIKVKSNRFNLYPLCKNNNKYIAYKENLNDKLITKIDDIKIFAYNNKKFLLWNYNYLLYLNNLNNKKIKISNHDVYNLKNPYQNEKFLFIPKQNNDFKYNKADVINSENGKLKTIKFNVDLFFDSYYLGTFKNDIYLFDRKNKQEYRINLKNDKVDKIRNQIYNNGRWDSISTKKLMTKKYYFQSDSFINYYLENNNLYLRIDDKQKILIDKFVNTIIKTDNYKVYYLKNDTLYYFNINGNYKKLLQYSEWQFNYKDMIFIFN